jgi:hypothetical protein
MVGGKLGFIAIFRQIVGACHDTGIVEQQMEREVLGLEFGNELGN